jgi:small GTP-binding protein
MSRQLRIGDHIVRLQTWDTSGQERFQSISRCYYRGANGLFAVFDLSNPSSLHDALQFVEEARHSMPDEAVVLLVGQKKDLPRKVKKRDAIEAALSIGASYVETSAKTGEGVHEAFLHITELIGNAYVPLASSFLF